LVWALMSFVITIILGFMRKIFFPKKPNDDVNSY
jgi:hypothetical protein